ncbi:hypothetical protein [Actinomycetospora cinnamomea]|uniref:Phosphodiesterase n=1 Tax=Actinomycetospora cinnamomea TaxID=663609 RepID=A0A2U1FRK7_9PSEU|nr:hypothetical protein [Actinomycetospora cinnamomea]PVZ14803.1 hypothetical protein C8D89_101671 [Actinomycetospora cinnamomea]
MVDPAPRRAPEPLPAPPPDPGDRWVDAVAGRVAGAAFGVASWFRAARSFHPRGRSFRGTLSVSGTDPAGATVLDLPGDHRAVVRLSRGAGLPEPLPDALGLAVRLLDADGRGGRQDLLLVSSGTAVGARHVIVPESRYDVATYSSLTPFRVGTERLVLGARALEGVGGRAGWPRLDDVADAVTAGTAAFALCTATPTGGWTRRGILRLGDELTGAESESLRFTPFHHAGGIEPVGVVNALRRRAYAESQAARPTP